MGGVLWKRAQKEVLLNDVSNDFFIANARISKNTYCIVCVYI